MAQAFLASLAVTDFRSYNGAALPLSGGPVVLFGPNGAGKTNLLEAVSYLSPGRGLRSATASEVGRRLPGERANRAWSVSALAQDAEGQVRIGTGVEPGGVRRIVRIDGEPAPPSRLAEAVRLVWLTPQQDRLFLEGGTERRRFLDRLTFSALPEHAVHAAAYEKAMRERLRLLTNGQSSGRMADPMWLDALEVQASEAGAALAHGRAATVEALQAEIDARTDRPFPLAKLSLSGEWGLDADPAEIVAALHRSRGRDAAAGRSLAGPGRTDLIVIHAEKDRPAAECSTGEQKALILNLVLAQASRLSRAESAPSPILLLDEVAAHLDAQRRAALAEEIAALGLQAFLTGTDRALFEAFDGAEIIRVEPSPETGGRLTRMERAE
jgi:DNA replication and repair protein RecF